MKNNKWENGVRERNDKDHRERERSEMKRSNSLLNILLLVILFSSVVVNVYFYMDVVSLRGDIAEIRTSYEALNAEYVNLMEEHRIIEDRLKYYELWNGEPEIANPRFLPPKGNQSKYVNLGAYRAVASKLVAIIDREEYKILKEVLVYHYPDWNNGTAYVALSDTSPEITNMILDLFSPYVREQIRLVKAPAPLNKIEEWEEALWSCRDDLKERGIKPTWKTMYYNGKILLGIEEITPNTISFFKEAIKEKVPPGVIVLEETGSIELEPHSKA
jgi:hypothetical protein